MIKHYEGPSCQTTMSTKAVAVASEPEGAGGSAAAEGAGASAAVERTRSGRRSLPPRRLDGVMRGQRYAD
jgi:hypothetical protein